MRRQIVLLALSVAAAGAVGCGSAASPTTPSTTTTTTTTTPTTVLTRKAEYAGTVATKDAKVTGRIDVSATLPTAKKSSTAFRAVTNPLTGRTATDAEAYPCSATLTLSNGITITLLGYYDTANDTVVLSGSGYLVISKPDSLFISLDGKVTMPDGTFGEAYYYQRTSTNVPELYCGTFTKSAGGGGWFTLTAFDGLVAGIGSDGAGTVALSGTLGSNGVANFTWVPEPGNFGRALGQLTGLTMNGTWTLTGIDNEKGNWNATKNACR